MPLCASASPLAATVRMRSASTVWLMGLRVSLGSGGRFARLRSFSMPGRRGCGKGLAQHVERADVVRQQQHQACIEGVALFGREASMRLDQVLVEVVGRI